MKKILLPFLVLFSSAAAHAGFITLEPVLGFAEIHSDVPISHDKTMFIYGARVVAGERLLAAELEYTQGSASENYSGPPTNYIYSEQTARLGARSIFDLSDDFALLARAGLQFARQNIETQTALIDTNSDGTWLLRPYVGGGMIVHLVEAIYLSAEVTYVLNSLSNFGQNDFETTLGFRIAINTR